MLTFLLLPNQMFIHEPASQANNGLLMRSLRQTCLIRELLNLGCNTD